jgi:zinc transporter ZupT
MITINVWTIFLAALITAVATGLGALPFFFIKDFSKRWLGISHAIAAGLMLGASHSLINEGRAYSLTRLVLGVLIGVFFMTITHRWLEKREDLTIGQMQGANALTAFMILGAMTLHSFSEGVGVGVSFGGGETLGIFITLAIAIHNIPEGLAISLIFVPRGESPWRAALWSVFSSLPQPLMAVPAFLFVTAFEPILPVGLGFAGGAMIWMVFSELVPDALEDAGHDAVAVTVPLAFIAMLIFQALLHA